MRLLSPVFFLVGLVSVPASAGMPAPGRSHTELAGCLKSAPRSAAPTRGTRAVSDAKIYWVTGGMGLRHSLSHSCGLKARVTTKISGRTVNIYERFTGRPSRCLCTSTIATDVGLRPGKWNARVYRVYGGSTTRVLAQSGTVPGAGGGGQAACRRSGCSGQVCADRNVVTTCEFRPEYACYRNAECKRQADGKCGWTQTAALRQCLASAGGGGQPACRKGGCSGQVCADRDVITTCEFRPEYACYRNAECKRQADGKCGWTQTAALRQCLANPPRP
jgi:hypothetical protein